MPTLEVPVLLLTLGCGYLYYGILAITHKLWFTLLVSAVLLERLLLATNIKQQILQFTQRIDKCSIWQDMDFEKLCVW